MRERASGSRRSHDSFLVARPGIRDPRLRRGRLVAVPLAGQGRADDEIAARGYSYRFAGHDDSLRVKTEAKRQAADRMRTRAARVETGSKVSEILRMVK